MSLNHKIAPRFIEPQPDRIWYVWGRNTIDRFGHHLHVDVKLEPEVKFEKFSIEFESYTSYVSAATGRMQKVTIINKDRSVRITGMAGYILQTLFDK